MGQVEIPHGQLRYKIFQRYDNRNAKDQKLLYKTLTLKESDPLSITPVVMVSGRS